MPFYSSTVEHRAPSGGKARGNIFCFLARWLSSLSNGQLPVSTALSYSQKKLLAIIPFLYFKTPCRSLWSTQKAFFRGPRTSWLALLPYLLCLESLSAHFLPIASLLSRSNLQNIFHPSLKSFVPWVLLHSSSLFPVRSALMSSILKAVRSAQWAFSHFKLLTFHWLSHGHTQTS